MNAIDLPATDVSLDTVEEEYVVEASSVPSQDALDTQVEPVRVRYGKRDGERRYNIEEVGFEDETVYELFRLEEDELTRPLQSALLFIDIEENPESVTEEYVTARDDAIRSHIESWEGDGVTVSESDFESMQTFIDRSFIQVGSLTGPFSDSNVEAIRVFTDEVIVEIDGDEYTTNIPVYEKDLRAMIIQLAQQSGEHISAADRFVEVTDGEDIDSFLRPVSSLSLELPVKEEPVDGAVVTVIFE